MKNIKKLYSTYLNMPAPAKASFWFMLCTVLQKGISMVTMPIFTRIMPSDQYGIVSVYNAWYGILGIFATLNLSAGVFNKGMIKFEDRKLDYMSSMLGLSGVATGILSIIYFLNPTFWESFLGLPAVLIITMLLTYFFEAAFSLWSVYERFHYKYRALIVITILSSVLGSAMSVLAVMFSSENKGNVRIISTAAVQIVVYFFIYIHIVRGSKRLINFNYWKYALDFNVPLIPHYLSMTILGQSDRIMIGNMVGTSEAAIYGVAYNISTLMTIVTNAISGSYVPFVYKSLQKKKYTDVKKVTNALLLFVAICSLLVLLLGPEIISFFAPAEYYSARWVMPPISAAVYFIFLYQLFGNVEFFFEKTKFIMIASCIGAATNIILNFIFIRRFGFIAAAYTSLVCYILFSVAHFLFSKLVAKQNDLNLSELYDFRGIAGISVGLVVLMLFSTVMYDNRIVRYSMIAVFGAVLLLKREKIICIVKSYVKK